MIRKLRLFGVIIAATAACGSPPSAVSDAGGKPSDAGLGDASDAMPDGSVDAGPPDMTIYAPRTEVEIAIEERHFEIDSCELDPDESCVADSGDRKLLRFSIETPNIGTGDIFLGAPSLNDDFIFSECHGHYHFLGYAEYHLVDSKGADVAQGQKQAFCLVDTKLFQPGEGVSPLPRYSCSYQGIQAGWSDIYASDLPCQFIDITDVTPGTYTLKLVVNAEGNIEESDTTNNIAEIEVDLTDPNLLTPTEACPDEVDDYALEGKGRECGWTHAGDFACTPGELVRLGCPVACFGGGSCSGGPMLRVCDADRSDGNCSAGAALETSTGGGCNLSCPRTPQFECPASGTVSAWTAPRNDGAAYECTVEIDPPEPT